MKLIGIASLSALILVIIIAIVKIKHYILMKRVRVIAKKLDKQDEEKTEYMGAIYK